MHSTSPSSSDSTPVGLKLTLLSPVPGLEMLFFLGFTLSPSFLLTYYEIPALDALFFAFVFLPDISFEIFSLDIVYR